MDGGAARVGLGGGADNLVQRGALEVKKVISTKFQNFCGCIGTHMLQGSFATGPRSRMHPAVREMWCVSKRFYDTSTGAVTGAARCGFLLKRVLVS
jgi:hypothetical protein